MSEVIKRLKRCLSHSEGLVHDEQQTIIDAIERIRELEKMVIAEQEASQAMTDRWAEANTRICELNKALERAREQMIDQAERAEAAEAKLRAVGGLLGKWREKYAPIVKSDGSVWRAAANELKALLKNNDKPRTRPIQGGYLEKDTTTGEVHEPTTERDWTSDAWSK